MSKRKKNLRDIKKEKLNQLDELEIKKVTGGKYTLKKTSQFLYPVHLDSYVITHHRITALKNIFHNNYESFHALANGKKIRISLLSLLRKPKKYNVEISIEVSIDLNVMDNKEFHDLLESNLNKLIQFIKFEKEIEVTKIKIGSIQIMLILDEHDASKIIDLMKNAEIKPFEVKSCTSFSISEKKPRKDILNSFKSDIYEKLSKKTEYALNRLKECLIENSSSFLDVVLIINKYNELRNFFITNLISFPEYSKECSLINLSITKLIENIAPEEIRKESIKVVLTMNGDLPDNHPILPM